MNKPAARESTKVAEASRSGTIWPVATGCDSDLQRKKKLAIRGANLAIVIMAGAGTTVTIATGYRTLSGLQIASLITASIAYTALSLYGTHDVIRYSLSQRGTAPEPVWRAGEVSGATGYFSVQLGLAALMFYLAAQAIKKLGRRSILPRAP